ncbi:MAG: Crp/Fnr family transcriptional regulator [Chloroflexota bacterium]
MVIQLDQLKTACFFSKLASPALEKISRFVVEKKYPVGDIILSQGDEDKVLYFAITGLVKLFATSAEGREFIVRLVYGGDSFNDDSFFTGAPSSLSAMALSPVAVYSIGEVDMETILRDYPQVYPRITEVMGNRHHQLVKLATELVFKNIAARLARLLLDMEKMARDGNKEARLTQQEMAFMIGTVRELVSRSLRELETMRAISLKHNQITIINRAVLTELSEL